MLMFKCVCFFFFLSFKKKKQQTIYIFYFLTSGVEETVAAAGWSTIPDSARFAAICWSVILGNAKASSSISPTLSPST